MRKKIYKKIEFLKLRMQDFMMQELYKILVFLNYHEYNTFLSKYNRFSYHKKIKYFFSQHIMMNRLMLKKG